MQVRVARIFNTYGPKMQPDDGRVVSNFIIQALRGEEITIYGDGQQTRSFCYVDDLIEALVRMMNNENGFIGPVNLGNPNEFKIAELAEKIIAKIGGKSRLSFKPLPADDPMQRKPDISLAYEQLGWQPKIELDEGLDDDSFFQAQDSGILARKHSKTFKANSMGVNMPSNNRLTWAFA